MHTINALTFENISKLKPTCRKPTTSTPLRNSLNENKIKSQIKEIFHLISERYESLKTLPM